MLSKVEYAKYKNWEEKGISFLKLIPKNDWNKLFKKLLNDPRIELMQSKMNNSIFPKPHFLFNAFKLVSIKNLKVVILGQDPYFNLEDGVPQAMGLSFSVPKGIKIPSSLKNIYINLLKFKHIKNKPLHGNLEKWSNQGVLLLNTALTVESGKANSHSMLWKWFTDNIIKYISNKKDHVVFVLWGNNAYDKQILIDQDKHELIISSHPSGLSASKPMKHFPAFNDTDHFGLINNYLTKWNYEKINW